MKLDILEKMIIFASERYLVYMKMDKKVVVFCGSGYHSLGLIRCLGEGGYRPECYCFGHKCDLFLSSRYISKGRKFESAEAVLNFLLNDYPIYDDRPILLTIPDVPAFLVDQYQNQLSRKFIVMNAGEQGKLGYWMDKNNMNQMAQKHGLLIPWTIVLSKKEAIPEGIKYPVFTKSLRTVDGGKCDESICRNKAELEKKRKSIASDRFLVVEYIQKKYERNYFGIALKGKVYIDYYDAISRFPDGAFGYYGDIINCDHDDIWEKCVLMMKDTGYNGLFDIEFLEDVNGKLYFMEVNFRVDGGIYKVTPGVNLPAEWCRLVTMAQEDLPDNLTTKKKRFTGMTEVQDFKSSVVHGSMNPLKWIWQFCNTDKYMLLNLKDPMPVLVWLFTSSRRECTRFTSIS